MNYTYKNDRTWIIGIEIKMIKKKKSRVIHGYKRAWFLSLLFMLQFKVKIEFGYLGIGGKLWPNHLFSISLSRIWFFIGVT